MLSGWSTSRTQLLPIRPSAWNNRGRGRIFERRAIVPFGGHYVLPEVVTDTERTQRILALAEFSGARSMLIGDDAIPITTAETTGPKMPGVFAKYVAAASRMSVVACISEAAATEYRGWKAMLPSAGLTGPDIVTVMLAETAETPDPAVRAQAQKRFLTKDELGTMPLVLCVGSHEPRKNHAAVLHAAELLWRQGHRFSMAFVGGNSWNSEEFRMRLGELRAQGRPAEALRGVPDSELWWAYSLARFTVFPSLNEGFGLPVTESLLSGTPVVASNFGSLAEIAAGGGCLLVDPRDDAAVAAGMAQLLTDDVLYERLAAEAANRAPRSWEQYADDVWHVLID
jgi:glycosyltransferase involved in cell wall biosynthesis